jgi:hypothetical protein
MYTYDYYIRQFQDAKSFIKKIDQETSDEVFLTAPAPDKWCSAELIQHLNLTAEVYLPTLTRCIEHAPDTLKYGGEPFKLGFLMRRFLGMVKPETKRKMPTYGKLKPGPKLDLDRKQIVQSFLAIQDEMIELVRKSQREHLVLDKLKFKNPEIPFLPMDANAAFAILEAHQRRHFDQITAAIKVAAG